MAGPAEVVPADFDVPRTLDGPGFRLEPLGPEHNERDYAAWTSSMDHIHETPGFAEHNWPIPMTLEENLVDLQQHADEFVERTGFTYSVLDGDEVIGCLYIYGADPTEPGDAFGHDAKVRSWVTASRTDLDVVLWSTVSEWLATAWPFNNPRYAPRT